MTGEAEIQFRPGRLAGPEQLWILTPRYATVVNHLEGTSATLPVIAFWTEWHERVKDKQFPSLNEKKKDEGEK